jgi:hypothetical protein
VNNTPGLLDVNPFAPGTADSFFDVFFEIEVGGQTLHNEVPARMADIIDQKPPGCGTIYQSSHEPIELLDEAGNATGIFMVAEKHTPVPCGFIEHDFFENTQAYITLDIGGQFEDVSLTGPTEVDVFFEEDEGDADDDGGNGLEEVETEIVSMTLTGVSQIAGPITVRESDGE